MKLLKLAKLLVFCPTLSLLAQNGFFTVHNFGTNNGNISGSPYAGVVVSGGTIFGTTESGSGRVFECNTDGSGFTNLYTFGGQANPVAGVVLNNGLLFGATENPGVVFALGTNFGSTLDVLWDFDYGYGSNPRATPTLSGVTLYGTTSANNLYKVITNATDFTNFYTFSNLGYDSARQLSTNSDGSGLSYGSLVVSGQFVFGTAEIGGANGNGTVFMCDSDTGAFTTLYTFSQTFNTTTNGDGANPIGGMALGGGTLYGTTSAGGPYGSGTIFSINIDGTDFTNLHNFSAAINDANPDGASPNGGLILSGGTLYGTTYYGGANGGGVVFKINTNGTGFTVMYTFSAGSVEFGFNNDGRNPNGALALSGNILYGTALNGGIYGQGTLFALNIAAPVPVLNIQKSADSFILTWSGAGVFLQSASTVNGPFADIIGAVSPYTGTFSGAQTFFRLASN